MGDSLFERLTSEGLLRARNVRRCPRCTTELGPDVADNGVCQECEFDLGESRERPTVDTIYIASGAPSREIPWLIALHGFNTLGDWQEEFGWLLATRFRHRAPALMHKFPFLFFGVLLRSRPASLAAELDRRLRGPWPAQGKPASKNRPMFSPIASGVCSSLVSWTGLRAMTCASVASSWRLDRGA